MIGTEALFDLRLQFSNWLILRFSDCFINIDTDGLKGFVFEIFKGFGVKAIKILSAYGQARSHLNLKTDTKMPFQYRKGGY
jgi:hypothetical protein